MRKQFDITEANMKTIKRVMQERNMVSEVQALRYILDWYEEQNHEKRDIYEEIKMQSIRQKEMERKIDILFDAVNTILIDKRITTCKPVALLESEVYLVANNYRKERLAALKQKKDYKQKD